MLLLSIVFAELMLLLDCEGLYSNLLTSNSLVSKGIEQLFCSAVEAELRLRSLSGACSFTAQVECVPSDHRIMDWFALEGTFQPSNPSNPPAMGREPLTSPGYSMPCAAWP